MIHNHSSQNKSESFAQKDARFARLSQRSDQLDMIGYRVVSVPNGQGAYKDGSLPSNHHIEFDYPDCSRELHQKSYLGYVWKVEKTK